MSEVPAGLRYSKTHEWVFEEGGTYTIGLTDFAQSELGEIVFINLPEKGDEVVLGEAFADVESVKAVSEVFSPVSGVVLEVNEGLEDAPESVNERPYEAWIVRVGEVSETEELLDAGAYAAHCEAGE